MFKILRVWWRYVATLLHVKHAELADPKVQLQQAITEAKSQHRRLREQAANVIANQQQTQLRLERAIVAHEQADSSARQALLLADREARAGDPSKMDAFNRVAEAFAGTAIERERDVRELEQVLLQATSAAESAKRAVAQNSFALQKRLAEQDDLLSKLDRAKLQEEVNKAMEVLSDTFGDIVPTVAEVQRKIETRLARAPGNGGDLHESDRWAHARGRGGAAERRGRSPAFGPADAARTRRARDEGAHGMSADQDFWQPPVSARDNGYISAAPLARVLRWMFGGWVMLTAFGASSSFFAYRTLSSYLDGDPSIDVNQVDTMHAIASRLRRARTHRAADDGRGVHRMDTPPVSERRTAGR